MIAAPTDIVYNYGAYSGSSVPIFGGNNSISFPEGSEAIGTGQANTNSIISGQGGGTYAAALCNDLILNGYDDWYLPSKDELNKLYINQNLIGGFVNGFYWSSTYFVYLGFQYFADGFISSSSPEVPGLVRPIRSF